MHQNKSFLTAKMGLKTAFIWFYKAKVRKIELFLVFIIFFKRKILVFFSEFYLFLWTYSSTVSLYFDNEDVI